jgi:RNA polymerase sigma-70 factor (ECF subfamily)
VESNPAQTVPDHELMRRYACGDSKAFEELYRRHRHSAWRFIYRSTRNRATADELMQEVWFSVARQARQYVPSARFTTWLFTIARNRVLNALRRSPAAMPAATAISGGLPADEQAWGGADNPQRQMQSEQELKRLLAAIYGLPTEQREAFLLQAEGDLSVAEIATVTEVKYETAKSRLRYARAALKQKLQEYA